MAPLRKKNSSGNYKSRGTIRPTRSRKSKKSHKSQNIQVFDIPPPPSPPPFPTVATPEWHEVDQMGVMMRAVAELSAQVQTLTQQVGRLTESMVPHNLPSTQDEDRNPLLGSQPIAITATPGLPGMSGPIIPPRQQTPNQSSAISISGPLLSSGSLWLQLSGPLNGSMPFSPLLPPP